MEKPFVLVADDNEATCTLVTAVLQGDFLVEISSDGMEAIEKLKSRQYAAILLDLLMPGVDGYAVLDFLTEHRPDLLPRVLVVTASISRREVERLKGYRFGAMIAKPFDVEALLREVKRCAHDGAGPMLPGSILSSGVLLLLADLLRQRLL